MRIAVPDLISNSYFPAVAAIELGYFKAEGLDAELRHVFLYPERWRRYGMEKWTLWQGRPMPR